MSESPPLYEHAVSPLCFVPNNPASQDQRIAAAADTLQHTGYLLAVLEDCAAQTGDAPALWLLVRVTQEALRHALGLLELESV